MPVKKSESDPTPAVGARGSGTPLQRYGWGLAIGTYAVSLGLLSERLSLWVDEVIQLVGTRDSPDLGALLRWVAINPGGVPLGYLTQHWAIETLGFSASSARLPSILSS